jgi:hypothetical protein
MAVKAVCRYPKRVYGCSFNSYSLPSLFYLSVNFNFLMLVYFWGFSYCIYIVTLIRTATIALHVACCCVSFETVWLLTVHTAIQVGVITKVTYTNVEHMFRPLLGHHQVYLSLLSCWIFFVQIWIHIFFIFDYKLIWLVLSNNLWFVYSLALSHIGIKVKLKEY